jgi:uncharacterized protein
MGFTVNPHFSDDHGKCMVWSENIFLMLLSHEKFSCFATKPIANTKDSLAGLFFLSLDTLEEVNQCIKKGIVTGGIESHPIRNYGFMQQRTLEEFDGHSWEIFTMDVTYFPQS